MTIGIYCIQFNNENECITYIGQSVNIENRITGHKIYLINNKHQNPYLQDKYNKYGIEYFIFDILEVCDKEVLTNKESEWMNSCGYPDKQLCFNIAGPGPIRYGEFNPMFKRKHTQETKKKMGEANQGEKHYKSKLTNEKVCFIKYVTSSPYNLKEFTYKELGEIFDINYRSIESIAKNCNWKHCSPMTQIEYLNYKKIHNIHSNKGRVGRCNFTDDQIKNIRERYANGEEQQSIAQDLGVVPKTIYRIIHRLTYSHVQ